MSESGGTGGTDDRVQELHGMLQRIGNSLEISVEAALQSLLRLLGDEGFSFAALTSVIEITDSRIWHGLLQIAAHGHSEAASPPAAASTQRAQNVVHTAFTARGGAASDAVRRQTLIDGLESPNASIRSLAAELLGRRGDPEAAEPLAALLHDPSDQTRAVAARALTALPAPTTLPYLLAALERNDLVAAEAVNGLIRIGEPAVAPLLDQLRHGNAWTRWHAVKALGGFGDPRAIEPLIAALSDEDSSVRWAAVDALAQIGPEVLDPLLGSLMTKEVTPWVAEGAGRVLARVATGKLYPAVAPLERLLQHFTALVEVPVAAVQARDQLRRLLAP